MTAAVAQGYHQVTAVGAPGPDQQQGWEHADVKQQQDPDITPSNPEVASMLLNNSQAAVDVNHGRQEPNGAAKQVHAQAAEDSVQAAATPLDKAVAGPTDHNAPDDWPSTEALTRRFKCLSECLSRAVKTAVAGGLVAVIPHHTHQQPAQHRKQHAARQQQAHHAVAAGAAAAAAVHEHGATGAKPEPAGSPTLGSPRFTESGPDCFPPYPPAAPQDIRMSAADIHHHGVDQHRDDATELDDPYAGAESAAAAVKAEARESGSRGPRLPAVATAAVADDADKVGVRPGPCTRELFADERCVHML